MMVYDPQNPYPLIDGQMTATVVWEKHNCVYSTVAAKTICCCKCCYKVLQPSQIKKLRSVWLTMSSWSDIHSTHSLFHFCACFVVILCRCQHYVHWISANKDEQDIHLSEKSYHELMMLVWLSLELNDHYHFQSVIIIIISGH